MYGAYYDLVKGGKYIWVVQDMHKKYGKAVRDISEVRTNDASKVQL